MKPDELVKIKSGISQAYWCDTSAILAKFQAAEIAFDTPNTQTLSWFDKLFEGGILLPKGNSNILRPITMLVSGPPGCGKTTLITEMCYRLAVNEQNNVDERGKSVALSTLYISTDAETDRMIDNAADLGWTKARDYYIPFDPEDDNPRFGRGLKAMIGVWGREKFLKTVEDQDMLSSMIEAAVTSLDKWVLKANAPDNILKRLQYRILNEPIELASKKYIPDILVVDSLNILNPEGQMKFFQSFVKACKATRLVIFVLNTGIENQEHKLWEYFSDIVVQLDHQYIHDYYVRTIEVVKARYQSHWWGKHQLKIYANPKLLAMPDENNDDAVREYNTMMKRSHPYRTTGGVFIFPSIHSYLSVYKRKTLSEKPPASESPNHQKNNPNHPKDDPDRDATYPDKLNAVFKLPKGRCTAFIGERGGHKSHLGYLHLLSRLKRHPKESCLIVSLREDESTTKKTLQNIAKQEFNCDQEEFDCLEKGNRLEVLYFPPGYITPEEFFHRMFTSVHRLKRGGGHLTVMFNSLDQISARFPLCAKQEIFIPGIIQTLSGEGATSICVAVDEPGQPVQQYGLLPMADLIVSFSMRRFSAQDYYNHVGIGSKDEFKTDQILYDKFVKLQEKANENAELNHEAVVLQVIRYSGGERAGKRGMLELVKPGEEPQFPYRNAGLQFTPLSEELGQGKVLSECS